MLMLDILLATLAVVTLILIFAFLELAGEYRSMSGHMRFAASVMLLLYTLIIAHLA